MKFDPNVFKSKSKQIMAESMPKQTGVAAVYIIVSLIFSYLLYNLSGFGNETVSEKLMAYYSAGYIDQAAEYLMSIQPSAFQRLASALLFFAFLIVDAGLNIFIVNSVRKAEPCYGNLLDGFANPFRFIVFSITNILVVSLGFMLLIVPGVLLFYSYRMGLYVLIDNPQLSPFECLHASRKLMRGHKLELFRLDLSFVVWFIVSTLPYIGTLSEILFIPYRYNSYVLFYDSIKNESK